MRRRLLVVGITGLLAGIASPLYQHFILRAASSLESGAFWAVLFYIGTALSIAILLLAIPRSQANELAGVRAIFLVAGCALICFHIYALVRLTWTRTIGPRAVVIVPDNFSGMFGIYIKDFLKPGIATAGKIYTFQVPNDGAIQAESGWIALTFTGRPDPYTTQIQLANGKPISPSCTWVSDEWMEQISPTSGSSRSKLLGIACRIGPGQIERADTYKFFRDHFKIEEPHNTGLQPTAARKEVLNGRGG